MKRCLVVWMVVGVVGLVCAAMPCFGAEAGEPLWELGVPDGASDEFALAPGGFADFDHDGFYYVGLSDASRDWPYAHPGPRDRFGGQKSRSFTILFSLDAVPEGGTCRLECRTADTHSETPPHLRFDINGKTFDKRLDAGREVTPITRPSEERRPQQFHFEFPVDVLREGENRIAISSLWGSWFLYDYIALFVPDGTVLDAHPEAITHLQSLQALPVVYRDSGEAQQAVRMLVRHFGEPCTAAVTIGDAPPVEVALRHGPQVVDVRHDAVTEPVTSKVAVVIGDKAIGDAQVALKPVRPWEVYLLHHTHLDIGYTHTQPEVARVQWENLEMALDLIDATRDYPEDAQFTWLPEGMWALDSYLAKATDDEKTRFFDAVREGRIGIDALYGNELTALCRPEELMELSRYARDLADEHDLPLDSAMITDVPGYTWGTVPALAQWGIRYLSMGPNATHRIGATLSTWGDKPFYWVSPSGEDRVLCWMAGKAYSWFHRGKFRDDQMMFDYLNALNDGGYPYDMVQVRYNINGDNGPPDEGISDFVRQWNETYAYPRLILATTSEMFHAFEATYGDSVPEVRGDFTPYWEDGAASSARETATNRDAAERLVQAETLWTLLRPEAFPTERFQAAWREVILYDEHTWGAWNSISDPHADFVRQQWAVKKEFTLAVDRQSKDLMEEVLEAEKAGTSVLVYNTQAWPRTGLAKLEAGATPASANRVVDETGRPVPSQRLRNGDLVFLAKDVPAMGSAAYRVEEGEALAEGTAKADGSTLANGMITVAIDEATGAIASLVYEGQEFVEPESAGLCAYLYVAGRDPKDPQSNGPVRISVGESGPLVSSLVVESDAPGCRRLTREYRVVSGFEHVGVDAIIDKEAVYDPEAVHLAFPFGVPEGIIRMDVPWAVVRPDVDQLPGACKNYFTVQRWVDVSNKDRGITWATLDAPMVELGVIANDPLVVGWLDEIGPTTRLYSYVMNNYWETNYKASQEGPTTFRYRLRPHGAYDQAEAQIFGVEQSQPLIAVRVNEGAAPMPGTLAVSPEGVMVTALRARDDGKGWLLRLFNGNDRGVEAQLDWGEASPALVRMKSTGESVSSPLAVPAYGIRTLVVNWE